MGKISGHLMNVAAKGKLKKPSLRISATMDTHGGLGARDDDKFQREELKRLAIEIRAMEEELDGLDPDEVYKKTLRSLRTEIEVKKARLLETKARLGDDDDEDEED